MKRFTPLIFLGLIFFTFLIGRVGNAYDRIHPQFLYLSLVNLILIISIFYNFTLEKVLSILRSNKFFLLYSLYIFFSAVSILFAINKVEAIITLSQYFTFFGSFIVLALTIPLYKINFIQILVYFSAAALVIESIGVLYSVYDFVFVNGNDFERSNTFSSFSGNINITAFSVVAKSSFVYYLLFKKDSSIKMCIIYTLILFLVSAALFFLLTRGALLAFFILNVIICLYLIIIRYDIKILRLKVIGLFFVFFSSYFFVSQIITNDNPSNLIADRVSSISVNSQDESIGQRLRYYNLSLDIISNNLITGIGIGNWKFISIEYDAPNIKEYTVPYHTHNDFLQIFSETGLFGGLSYFGIFIIAFLSGVRSLLNSEKKLFVICLIGAMVVYSIDSLLNFPVSRPISHIYFLFLLAGFNNLNKTK